MKRLIYYLLFICTSLSINAKNIYELSSATCTAESKSTGPWAFNEGFVISASDPNEAGEEEDLTEGRNTNLFFTPVEQMENIDRAPIALPASNGKGIFISWRLLGTDNPNTTFDIIRNGTTIVSGSKTTNFTDNEGTTTSSYEIAVKDNGNETERTTAFTPWENIFLRQTLDRPDGGSTPANETYTYSPNDCSIGDIDGDGQYELFVKWDPSNSKDNSQAGYTGNVFIDAYKLDMTSEQPTRLWRIDLGVNTRAGAHYTQFLVYDFDGDGKV